VGVEAATGQRDGGAASQLVRQGTEPQPRSVHQRCPGHRGRQLNQLLQVKPEIEKLVGVEIA
jgi:hypothetical protein